MTIIDYDGIRYYVKDGRYYRREISGIVSYVDKLAKANVVKEQATINLSLDSNVLRSDLVLDWDKEEKILALNNAPKKNKRFIAVPRILEQ